MMKKEFQIFKEGVTDYKITIMSNPKERFDRDAKIKRYLSLGYNVYNMKGKEIK